MAPPAGTPFGSVRASATQLAKIAIDPAAPSAQPGKNAEPAQQQRRKTDSEPKPAAWSVAGVKNALAKFGAKHGVKTAPQASKAAQNSKTSAGAKTPSPRRKK